MTNRLKSLLAGALLALAAMVAGPTQSAQAQDNGFLVSDVGSNSVLRFNAQGQYQGVFASGGGLSVPYGLSYGPDNNLYVASLATHQILRYNSNGSFRDVFAPTGSGGLLYYPNQIAFGPDGNAYVSSFSSNAVLRIGSNGVASVFASFAGSGSNPGLVGPTGISFGAYDGNLYVSSSGNNSVFVFDGATGALLNGGALIPGSTSGLVGPAGLAIGPDGNLYVANFNDRTTSLSTGVFRYAIDTPGNPRTVFTTQGGQPFNVNGPVSVNFGLDGFLYVTSYRNNTIYRFNAFTGARDTNWSITGVNLSGPLYMTFIPTQGGGLEPVPEPGSFILLGLGLGGVVALRRFRKPSAKV